MASTIAAPPRIALPPQGNGGRPDPAPHSANRTGLILALASVSMMFIGLTSAYVVSQGLNPLWKQVHMRPLIWIDTAILLFSSYSMERARRDVSSRWLIATLLLGIAFLAGQIGCFAHHGCGNCRCGALHAGIRPGGGPAVEHEHGGHHGRDGLGHTKLFGLPCDRRVLLAQVHDLRLLGEDVDQGVALHPRLGGQHLRCA